MELKDFGFLALLVVVGLGFIIIGLQAIRLRQARAFKRPEWDRMLADTEYFRKAMGWIFKRRGYRVVQSAAIPVAGSEGPREILFRLEKDGQTFSALCGRWVAVVGSDQVMSFQERLARSFDLKGAMLITTGKFTPSAYEQAAGTPLALHDGDELRKWVES